LVSLDILWFVALGLLGGFSYIVMTSKKWDDFKKYGSQKRIVLGAVIGLLYYYLHSDYNFPNALMTWVSGYMGSTFIDHLIQQYQHLKS